MIAPDQEKLAVELCKKWPNKFTDDDLEYWCRELGKFRVEDVLEVMNAWKAESRFVPRLPELRARLAKRSGSVVASSAPKYTTVLARDVAKANPHLDGRHEGELILRYHRRYWRLYRADSEKRAQMQGLQGQAIETVNRERKLENQTNEAVRDLISAGMDPTAARSTAGCLDWPEPQFAEACEDLANVGLTVAA